MKSPITDGESYIVVNYEAHSRVRRVFVLWEARDEFFSPRVPRSNARAMLRGVAVANIETLFDGPAQPAMLTAKMAKAGLRERPQKKAASS